MMRSFILILIARPGAAPAADRRIYDAIVGCRKLTRAGTQQVLDVVSSSMIVGAECTSSRCCWAMAGTENLLGVTDERGTKLQSYDSKALVKYWASKAIRDQNYPGLVQDTLLYALWAVDPESYFFAYVDSSKKLQAVPLPSRVGANRVPSAAGQLSAGSPSDEILPTRIQRSDLVIIWRSHALLLLFVGAAHQLAGNLGDVEETAGASRVRLGQARACVHALGRIDATSA